MSPAVPTAAPDSSAPALRNKREALEPGKRLESRVL